MNQRHALILVVEETPSSVNPQIVTRQIAVESLAKKLFAKQFEEIWGFPLSLACNPEECHHITYEYVEGDAIRQVTLVLQNADEAPEVASLPLMELQELADSESLHSIAVKEEKR